MKENREVFSEEMKLRLLIKKGNADFLKTTKATIDLELSRTPMTMAYNHSPSMFRNEVDRKFIPDLSSNNKLIEYRLVVVVEGRKTKR